MCHPACVVLRVGGGNSNKMPPNQSHRAALCAKPTTHTHTHAHLLHPPSLSPMVQPSHRVHVSWQRLSDPGPQEEKRGERIMASLILISLKKKKRKFAWVFFFSSCPLDVASPLASLRRADHREEAARPDQPQPVGAQEAGAQRV